MCSDEHESKASNSQSTKNKLENGEYANKHKYVQEKASKLSVELLYIFHIEDVEHKGLVYKLSHPLYLIHQYE